MKKIITLLLLGAFIVPYLNAHPAWGIVVDKDRNIYFADLAHNGMGSVWKLTNEGELKLLLQDFHAHNVSLDQRNNLITAHGETPHTLVSITPNGSIDTLYHTMDYKDFFGGNCAWSSYHEKVIYGLREHKYLRELDTGGTQKSIGDYEFKITKIDKTGNKSILFNYDSYEKGEMIPTKDQKNNNFWWIFTLSGIIALMIIVGFKKVKITTNKS